MGAPIMRVEPRRQSNDCAVWALSTYLGVPYDEVWQTVVRPLKRLSAGKITDDSYGVLVISEKDEGHAVVVRNGLIFDTDSTVWDLPSWLEVRKCVIEDLLTED